MTDLIEVRMIWVNDLSDPTTSAWLVDAWDEFSIDDNPEGWEKALSDVEASHGRESVRVTRATVEYTAVKKVFDSHEAVTGASVAFSSPAKPNPLTEALALGQRADHISAALKELNIAWDNQHVGKPQEPFAEMSHPTFVLLSDERDRIRKRLLELGEELEDGKKSTQ